MEKIKSAIKFNRKFREAGMVSKLKMVKVNGQYDRVNGFVVNPENNKIQYINIDCGRLTSMPRYQFMHRTAEHLKDYRGGHNKFTKNSDSLIEEVLKELQ